MARASGGSCAIGIVLLLLAGCSVPEFFNAYFVQGTDGGGDRVVAGSVESVSQTTQGALRTLGMRADVMQDGTDVRIASKTSQGNGFVMVLSRVQNEKGESTKVHMEWEKNADQQTGGKIFTEIDAQSRR